MNSLVGVVMCEAWVCRFSSLWCRLQDLSCRLEVLQRRVLEAAQVDQIAQHTGARRSDNRRHKQSAHKPYDDTHAARRASVACLLTRAERCSEKGLPCPHAIRPENTQADERSDDGDFGCVPLRCSSLGVQLSPLLTTKIL